jgi:hypothetical protein
MFTRVPVAALAVAAAVIGFAAYANLSLLVTDPADYRYFPPFQPSQNANRNFELGGENFEIARSLVAGHGFASPFKEPTGPTAWMPPLLPILEAGVLWACEGNRDAVMAVAIVFQVVSLVVTGFLVVGIVGESTGRAGRALAATVFVLALIGHFVWWFQRTHDNALVLLTLDGLLAAIWWGRPLRRWRGAAGWGVFGGVSALVSPAVGFTWAILTLTLAVRCRAWSKLAVAAGVAAIVLAPWAVRNAVVFGRVIPVKSNLAYELYQSQCLQPDGLIQQTTLPSHPYQAANRERREYRTLGEAAFMDRKREQFWEAVRTAPLNFAGRVADRFVGVALWYVPFNRTEEARRPWVLWACRLTQALPLLAVLVLLLAPGRQRLTWPQVAAMGMYCLYLLPYVVASYYERYAAPLLGVKVLLVVWAVDRLVSYLPARSAATGVTSGTIAEDFACPRS